MNVHQYDSVTPPCEFVVLPSAGFMMASWSTVAMQPAAPADQREDLNDTFTLKLTFVYSSAIFPLFDSNQEVDLCRCLSFQ